MRVLIEGFELPGAHFCDRDGVVFDGVHVGLQVGREPVGLVPGDAASARWEIDVDVVAGGDGEIDFRGKAVHGKRGDRFVYLTWGQVHDGVFDMFGRAKLMLSAVDPQVITKAASGRTLVGTIRLTDERGGPRCARVDAPDLTWRVD